MNSRMEDFERRYRELLDRARKKEVPDISNQDLNNIIKTGSYSGLYCSNTPNQDPRFVRLIVTNHTNDWTVQEVITADEEIYLRAHQGNIWYEWKILDLEDENATSVGLGITVEVIERTIKHPNATEQESGFMSAEDKQKLNQIADRANNYIHPEFHPASMITEEMNKQFVSETDKVNWNSKANGDHTHSDIQAQLNRLVDIPKIVDALQGRIKELEAIISKIQVDGVPGNGGNNNSNANIPNGLVNIISDLQDKVNAHIEPDL